LSTVVDPLDRVGGTPLVRVTQLDTGPASLWLKLESHNPGGSIKDRVGVSMVRAAERDGRLGPHQPKLVEATAGNTGLGLALAAAQRGYELTLVIPDKMSQEKVLHAKALGARVVMTRSDVSKGHPAYYVDLAKDLAGRTGAYFVNQFENPANPLAHETTTGPEIWSQTGGKVDAVVCGVGSGGTLTGLGRFFARAAPHVEIVLADPVGSALAGIVRDGRPGPTGPYLVEGIGQDAVPPICELSRASRAYTIEDREAFAVVRELLQKEGILAGTSTGTLVAAALRYCREQKAPRTVVSFVCDTGNKYLSKAFSDAWMIDQGLSDAPAYGDLRDFIGRRAYRGDVVAVEPSDTLGLAHSRMRLVDVSQLPVLEGTKIVGLVDESDLLMATLDDPSGFRREVREVMSTDLRTVDVRAPVRELLPIFAGGMVAIVMDRGEFLGLVTKIDLLNRLRRSVAR
jgi:cystathionine beta-synthase